MGRFSVSFVSVMLFDFCSVCDIVSDLWFDVLWIIVGLIL